MLPTLTNEMVPNPPAKMKVFAPNGETKELTCWTGVRISPRSTQLTELFLLHESGFVEVLNKKVVIQNLETGEVIYNPRLMPKHFAERVFITASETQWLQANPHWPNILELCDNPVEKDEKNEGLHRG